MMTLQLPAPPKQLRRSPRLSHKAARPTTTTTPPLSIVTTSILPRNPVSTDDERKSLSPTPLLYDRKKRSRNASGRFSSKKRKLSVDNPVHISEQPPTTTPLHTRPERVSPSRDSPPPPPSSSSSLQVDSPPAPPPAPASEVVVENHEVSPVLPHPSTPSVVGHSLSIKDIPNSDGQDYTPSWDATILDPPNFQAVVDSTVLYPPPPTVHDQLPSPTQVSPYVILAPLPTPPSFPQTSSSLCHALSYSDPSQDVSLPPIHHHHHQTLQDIQDRYSLARRTLCLARRALWALITKAPWIPSETDDSPTPLDPDRISATIEHAQVIIPTTEQAIRAAKDAERAARQRQQRELKSLRQCYPSIPGSPSVAGWKRSSAEIRDAPIWKAVCCAKVAEIVESTKPQTIRSVMDKQLEEYYSVNKPDNWYLRCVPPGQLPIQDGAVLPSIPSPSSTCLQSSPYPSSPVDNMIMMDHEEGDIHDFEFYPFELDSDEDADADGETVTEESDCEESVKDETVLCPGEERLDFGDITPTTPCSSSIPFNNDNTSSSTIPLWKKHLPSLSSIPISSIPLSAFHMLLFSFSSGESSETVPRGTPVDYARKNDWWMAGPRPSSSPVAQMDMNMSNMSMTVDPLPLDPLWNPQPVTTAGASNTDSGPMDWDGLLGVVDENGRSSFVGGQDMGYSLG